MADLDKWIEIAKECKYLPENDLKQLCDIVSDLLVRNKKGRGILFMSDSFESPTAIDYSLTYIF